MVAITRSGTVSPAQSGSAAAPPKAPPPPLLDSVVYWGFNPTNAVEIKALDGASALDKPVTVITNPAPGTTTISVGTATYDLTKSSDLSAFTRAIGAPDPAKLQKILSGISAGKLVDAARFAMVMAEGEAGTRDVRRLVLSGHSAANRLWGEAPGLDIIENGVWYKDVLGIAASFPKAAAKVQHLLMSACSSGFAAELKMYRDTFPNVQSITAWAGASPSTKKSAPPQLAAWVKATEKGAAKDIDPALFGGAKGFTGSNVITWNKVDGYQGPSYAQARAVVDANKGALPKPGPALDLLYFAMMAVIFSDEFKAYSEADKDALRQRACDALALRHPEVAPLNTLGMLKQFLSAT